MGSGFHDYESRSPNIGLAGQVNRKSAHRPADYSPKPSFNGSRIALGFRSREGFGFWSWSKVSLFEEFNLAKIQDREAFSTGILRCMTIHCEQIFCRAEIALSK